MLVGIYLYYIKVFSLTSRISLIFTNTIIGYMANIFSFWRDMGTFITPLASFSSFFFLQFYFTSLFSLSRNSSIIINYLIYTQKYIYFCYLIIKNSCIWTSAKFYYPIISKRVYYLTRYHKQKYVKRKLIDEIK